MGEGARDNSGAFLRSSSIGAWYGAVMHYEIGLVMSGRAVLYGRADLYSSNSSARALTLPMKSGSPASHEPPTALGISTQSARGLKVATGRLSNSGMSSDHNRPPSLATWPQQPRNQAFLEGRIKRFGNRLQIGSRTAMCPSLREGARQQPPARCGWASWTAGRKMSGGEVGAGMVLVLMNAQPSCAITCCSRGWAGEPWG